MAETEDVKLESETLYGILATADYFLSLKPKRVPEALQCLLASLKLHPPARIRTQVCCRVGMLLYMYTWNVEDAKEYLNQAKITEHGVKPTDANFEAHCQLARIHCEQNVPQQAKVVLRGLLEQTMVYPYWHLRFLFQLAETAVCEHDSHSAISYLGKAAEYASGIGAEYPRILSLLSQGAYYLLCGKYSEGGMCLNTCGQAMEGYSGPRGPSLKAFYLVIQVCHLLWAGQITSAKPHLKQLQACFHEISTEPPHPESPGDSPNANSFTWMSKDEIYLLIYLMCMMFNLQSGNTGKVLGYGEKALALIAQRSMESDRYHHGNKIVDVLKVHILENMMAAHLMQGRYTECSKTLKEVMEVCRNHPKLVYSHRSMIHLFLGLYSYSTDNLDSAVSQFKCALQHTNIPELKLFITLNLILTYIRIGSSKESELSAVIDTISLESVNPVCQGLRAAVLYVKGLHAYTKLKINDAKHCLRESLMLSNSNDLNKLTVCALVLLGQIYIALGNKTETHSMIGTSVQLANKMPDRVLQMWSTGLSNLLNQANGVTDAQLNQSVQLSGLLQQLVEEKRKAKLTSEDSLIQWTVGEWPVTITESSGENVSVSHLGVLPHRPPSVEQPPPGPVGPSLISPTHLSSRHASSLSSEHKEQGSTKEKDFTQTATRKSSKHAVRSDVSDQKTAGKGESVRKHELLRKSLSSSSGVLYAHERASTSQSGQATALDSTPHPKPAMVQSTVNREIVEGGSYQTTTGHTSKAPNSRYRSPAEVSGLGDVQHVPTYGRPHIHSQHDSEGEHRLQHSRQQQQQHVHKLQEQQQQQHLQKLQEQQQQQQHVQKLQEQHQQWEQQFQQQQLQKLQEQQQYHMQKFQEQQQQQQQQQQQDVQKFQEQQQQQKRIQKLQEQQQQQQQEHLQKLQQQQHQQRLQQLMAQNQYNQPQSLPHQMLAQQQWMHPQILYQQQQQQQQQQLPSTFPGIPLHGHHDPRAVHGSPPQMLVMGSGSGSSQPTQQAILSQFQGRTLQQPPQLYQPMYLPGYQHQSGGR